MPAPILRALAVSLSLPATAALADPQTLRSGDDLFLSGLSASETLAAPRDVLAAGATVSLRGTVGQDLNATGFTVRATPEAVTTGNARLSGGVLTIEGPVTGAQTASGGDVVLAAGSLRLGPAAKLGGSLRYYASAPVVIHASVIAPDRVTFVETKMTERFRDMGEMMGGREFPRMPGAMSLLAGFAVTLGFLALLGAAFLAFLPGLVETLRQSALARPGRCLVAGFLGLACLFGLVPVSAMSILGMPLVPFALLALLVLWTLAYLLGACALALRPVQALGGGVDPGIWARTGALVVGVVRVALLNFMPFLGRMVNLTLVLWGLGVMVLMLAGRFAAQVNRPSTGTAMT